MKKKSIRSVFSRTIVGVLGFILSPLSWWNDFFVNFPLSYAFAWLIGRPLSLVIQIRPWLFVNFFIAGYFLTNLVGFLMIHYSIAGTYGKSRSSIFRQMFYALLYTLVILIFFSLDICNPDEGCLFFPSWVKGANG